MRRSAHSSEVSLPLVHAAVEQAIGQSLYISDEAGLDPAWERAFEEVHGYTLRPAKRVRPALVVAGYALGRPGEAIPESVWRFAAGMELLHTFLLIHDDVADRAELRRGEVALHRKLAPGRMGEDLAVVMGDHLFARAIEVMLASGAPGAAEVTTWFLSVCRHTAVGQFLDLQLAAAPLQDVTLFQTLKVAHLKTARYGFVAPLVCGARLAGADEAMLEALERVGRHAGLAFQLRDDLIGLFGDPAVSGKSADSDIEQGKRTFPLIAAWIRADEAGRAQLERLCAPENLDPERVEAVRSLVQHFGGRGATERAIDRCTRSAMRAIEQLPSGPAVELLLPLLSKLARRAS